MIVDRERVLNVIRERVAPCPADITDECRFIEELGADSLDCLDIVMEMEDVFAIAILDEEAEKVRTIGEAVALVIEKAKAA